MQYVRQKEIDRSNIRRLFNIQTVYTATTQTDFIIKQNYFNAQGIRIIPSNTLFIVRYVVLNNSYIL
jgi:hypothetical protein